MRGNIRVLRQKFMKASIIIVVWLLPAI